MEILNKTQKKLNKTMFGVSQFKICEMKLISSQIRSFTLLENVRVSALAITRL